MVQQGTREIFIFDRSFCLLFLSPLILQWLRGCRLKPGSRKAKTRLRELGKLQKYSSNVRKAVLGSAEYKIMLFPVNTAALFTSAEILNTADHEVT